MPPAFLTAPHLAEDKSVNGAYWVAAIVAVPFARPMANPLAEIETIEESELLQTTDEVTSFPRLSIAWNCT